MRKIFFLACINLLILVKKYICSLFNDEGFSFLREPFLFLVQPIPLIFPKACCSAEEEAFLKQACLDML